MIIVHIGPSKTATTSLQVALDTVSHPAFCYGGALMPRRTRDLASLSNRVYTACVEERVAGPAAHALREEIESLQGRHAAVVLSEERFLEEFTGPPVAVKLRNLGKLLAGLDVRIVLTLRRAQDALPAYYQEKFADLHLLHVAGFAAFCRHPVARCYDYDHVRGLLHELGFNDIKLITFEGLVSGKMTVGGLTGLPLFDALPLHLPHRNQGRRDDAPSARILPPVSLKGRLARSAAVARIVDTLGLRQWRTWQRVRSWVDGITWRREHAEKLVVPQEVLAHLNSAYETALIDFSAARLKT